jgi:hypothetical protein
MMVVGTLRDDMIGNPYKWKMEKYEIGEPFRQKKIILMHGKGWLYRYPKSTREASYDGSTRRFRRQELRIRHSSFWGIMAIRLHASKDRLG